MSKNMPATIEVMRTFQVIPHEQGVMEGYQNDGHDLPEYIAELIDNAIDAKASKVKLYYTTAQVKPNSKDYKVASIIIGDDGIGIPASKIESALQIGIRSLDPSRIGRYGIGLKASAFGLGTELIVITKTSSGVVEVYQWTPYNITNRKDFGVSQIKPNAQHLKLFKDYTDKESGTVIVISGIHEQISKRMLSKTNNFEQTLARLFAQKISKEFNLSINGKNLKPNVLVREYKVLVSKNLKCIKGASLELVERKDDATMAARGTYLFLQGRQVNQKPFICREFGFNHPTYNHLILKIMLPQWSPEFSQAGLKISNQKNNIEIEGIMQAEIIEAITPFIKAYDNHLQNIKKLQEKHGTNPTQETQNSKSPKIIVDNGEEISNSKMENSWKTLAETIEQKEGVQFTVDQQKDLLENRPSKSFIREPRNLNKFDNKKSIPKTLRDAGLIPYPVSNTTLELVKINDVFIKIPQLKKKNVEEFNLKTSGVGELKSLGLSDVSSEKKAINLCFHHGIIHQAFGEKTLARTVEGMERLSKIDMKIGKRNLTLEGVQIEVDAGYEGKVLHLMEAKMVDNKGLDDINIRQLVPAHVHYQKKTYPKMTVQTWVFLWYRNENIVRFIPVTIDITKGNYSLDCANEKSYKLVQK